jgi:allophanate hydrolase
MRPGLDILMPGLHTSVQDLGRIGWQAFGVPVSGALDGMALRLANLLTGNPPGTAALEILLSGPTFRVVADAVRVALGGAAASLHVDGAASGPVAAWQSVRLRRGDIVSIAVGPRAGCCYLAVEGGIVVPPVLGSASTYARAGFGGFGGRTLQRGDLLPLVLAEAPARGEQRLADPPPMAEEQPIRVVLGPQQDHFTDVAVANLLGGEYRISNSADRMGLRLDGPALTHRQGWDIVSDAIATGAIQVPGSGQPILLLADHQTTGGYPKIATVVSADLPTVGRRRPGASIRFAAVSIAEAEDLARDAERRFATFAASFEPAPSGGAIEVGRLYAGNLISGVVSARD